MAKTKTVVTVISKISERPGDQAAALVVIYGPDLGKKYDLDRPETVIGRSSKADIMVDQESISRSHAALTNKGGTVSIRDMGSTNGTFVNDEMVHAELQLRNGDLVKIGRTIFKFIGGGNIEAAYHDEIYRLTTVDGLTQISNRRFFEEALEREISRCNRYNREMSLVLIDLDHFKQINDRYGHLAGDTVLKQIASAIQRKIRKEDVFARYGGEEFALILPEVDLKGAASMAEKVRKLVGGHKFEFDGQRIPVTVSAGVAVLTDTQREPADVVRAADARLYEAKSTGRNKVGA
ncbi:MAG TPA: GGDEF domain-containing protein [Myxococcaceae bacterium]